MNIIDFENLILVAEKTLNEIDPFLIELNNSQKAHQIAIDSGKSIRETVALYFERTDNEAKGEKVLQFLKKIVESLSSTLNELEKQILLLEQNKDTLSAKWTVYSNLSSVLISFPNGSINRIRFEMHAKKNDWENYLEDSSIQILQSMENNLASASTLAENAKNILGAIFSKNGRVATSKLSEIMHERRECEEKKKKIATLLSKVAEKATMLSTALENSFI